ncbi:unnamed protein product [Nezara viridula]|uniref:Uncharacterized protein n=1 Tax=Nezara viridula TaxID=85310 RepID=A0A9P0H8T4_NEZVI|nr:unnamed protein product [Nezara viridula]
MSDDRLPRQCFNRLRALDSSIGKPDPTYNWATQVKMIVAALGCQRLFSCVFLQGLMRFKDEIMEKIRNHHASKDIDRVLNSKSNPRYRKICSFNVTRPEDYLQFRALNLNKLRAVSRLRVASKDFMKIYLKDATLTIKSSENRAKWFLQVLDLRIYVRRACWNYRPIRSAESQTASIEIVMDGVSCGTQPLPPHEQVFLGIAGHTLS